MGAISYIAEYNRFRDFLRENGCEEAFDRAFAAYNHCAVLDLNLWELLGTDESLFGWCFDWSETVEGREYWKEIDRKWFELCLKDVG